MNNQPAATKPLTWYLIALSVLAVVLAFIGQTIAGFVLSIVTYIIARALKKSDQPALLAIVITGLVALVYFFLVP